MTPGQRHTNLFKLACEACKRGYSEKDIFRKFSAITQEKNFGAREIEQTISSGYKTVITSNQNKPASNQPAEQASKTPKSHYGTFENEKDEEEAYWKGEEFRKRTPIFPDNLYNNLPSLLDKCILEDLTPREKDVALLASITALSAALPCTFGMYNKKLFSPHLFNIIIAPAGSGKSIAQVGRYLLDNIHEHIYQTSVLAQKSYRKEHDKWLRECNNHKRGKNEEAPTVMDEPEAPPFKMLIIPGSTSYTRMQMQLRDNDSMGGIIIDTEAQTLSTANHLDCGNFDDMLRKAFEHENIDSSFKSNGMVPISIRHPKMAMLLTGTPAQLNDLLSNSENGLGSRVLFYTFREDPKWKEMGEDSFSFEDYFKERAVEVAELYQFCMEHPVTFSFTKKQWGMLNQTFAHLLSEVAINGNDNLQAVVKRYAFITMRVSMIQTRIRQFENKDLSQDIFCNDIDFERSIRLVLCCYEHSRLLLMSMSSKTVNTLKNPDEIKDFIDELPDTFTTEEAQILAEKHGFSTRKVTRVLKALISVNINKLSHGLYTKCDNQ